MKMQARLIFLVVRCAYVYETHPPSAEEHGRQYEAQVHIDFLEYNVDFLVSLDASLSLRKVCAFRRDYLDTYQSQSYR